MRKGVRLDRNASREGVREEEECEKRRSMSRERESRQEDYCE